MVRLASPHDRRQNSDPTTIPTANGVSSGVLTVGTEGATASSLAFDASVTAGPDFTNPGLAASTPVVTLSPTSQTSPSSTPDGSSTPTSAATTHTIPMTTVIGACVGAFAGAVFLICIGLYFYKRSTQALKARARAPLSSIARNTRGDLERSRSHRGDPWNKLESGDEDKWEGMNQTSEIGHKSDLNVPPMEKLTMFKKTPSIRTAVTTQSHEELPLSVIDANRMHPFNNPLTTSNAHVNHSNSHPDVAHGPLSVDTGAINWGAEAEASYLTVRSSGFDFNTARALSPTVNPARPTPPATAASTEHRWESAEVVNPFTDDGEGQEAQPRTSSHNPFFNAYDFDIAKSKAVAKAAKSKEKNETDANKNNNPFLDPTPSSDNTTSESHSLPHGAPGSSNFTPPFASKHSHEESVSSGSDSDRAIMDIIAALDNSNLGPTSSMTPEPTRVVSGVSTTGYSIVDGYLGFDRHASAITTSGEGTTEEDMTSAFPLPPHKVS